LKECFTGHKVVDCFVPTAAMENGTERSYCIIGKWGVVENDVIDDNWKMGWGWETW